MPSGALAGLRKGVDPAAATACENLDQKNAVESPADQPNVAEHRDRKARCPDAAGAATQPVGFNKIGQRLPVPPAALDTGLGVELIEYRLLDEIGSCAPGRLVQSQANNT